jgi:hypothetical protein
VNDLTHRLWAAHMLHGVRGVYPVCEVGSASTR